jgi:hypothetical protein
LATVVEQLLRFTETTLEGLPTLFNVTSNCRVGDLPLRAVIERGKET